MIVFSRRDGELLDELYDERYDDRLLLLQPIHRRQRFQQVNSLRLGQHLPQQLVTLQGQVQ
jgi:hypothetical protein